jgi:hypothetical protein
LSESDANEKLLTAEQESAYVHENAKKESEISQVKEKASLQTQLNEATKAEAVARESAKNIRPLAKLKAQVLFAEQKSDLIDQDTKAQTAVQMQTYLRDGVPKLLLLPKPLFNSLQY